MWKIVIIFLITVALIAGTVGFVARHPIEIRDWYDLNAIRDNLGSSYLLMNNLDSTTSGYEELASPTANGGKGCEPIESLVIPSSGCGGGIPNVPPVVGLTGTFDGQGYEIRDLFINRPGEDYVGLFRSVDEGGIVKNVGVVNVTVNGNKYVGGLAGENDGTVSNSYATGSVTGCFRIGGLVGRNEGWVSDSYATGNFTGSLLISDVGGLVGWNDGTVSNSYATGSVTGGDHVGGLMGHNVHGTVSNSYATGNVTGKERVGGLAGRNHNGAVNNSYSSGNVTGYKYVGGLVGENQFYGTVSNSYSTGSVTGNEYVGGLVGHIDDGTVSNSFWDIETSGQSTSDGWTGKNTTEIQDIATFSGAMWNIIAVAPGETNDAYTWNIIDKHTYPFLSWEL
jgi:hypothetical protein